MIVNGKAIGLTAEQKSKRGSCIGGSDANAIMAGGEKAYECWAVKTELAPPPNFDDVLPVIMGQWTEELNLYWFSKQTGRVVSDAGKEFVAHDIQYMTCTVDGMAGDSVVECKHVGGFEAREKVLSRYWPQLHHNMHVCGLSNAVLSVFEGNSGYWYQDVEMDLAYMNELLEREREFWGCVQSKTWTGEWKPVEATIPTSYREVDMTGHNLWADQAMQWLQHRPAKQAFDKAEKELKGMVAVDVSRAHGHGVEVKRDRSNKLRIGTTNGPTVD